MTDNDERRFPNGITELSLGEIGRNQLIQNTLTALGYEYNGPKSLQGRSGLLYEFEGVGVRPSNVALVVAGARKLGSHSSGQRRSPRQQVEQWVRDALLQVYDVGAFLESQDLKVDLLFIHNSHSKIPPENIMRNIMEKEPYKLGVKYGDYSVHHSVSPIDVAPSNLVSDIAHSVGAGYFSIDDITLSEIATLSNNVSAETIAATKVILNKLRLTQYFNPPTDELILTALSLAPPQEKKFVTQLVRASSQLGHPVAPNVLVPDVDYLNPVETAVALEKHKLIDYHGRYEITPDGKKITHEIRKTAQESFVIKLIRALQIPDLAKALIEAIKAK